MSHGRFDQDITNQLHYQPYIYHFISTTDEDRDSARVLALFDHQHPVLCGAKSELSNYASIAKFFGCQLLETWNDTPTSGNGDQL